MPDYRLIKNGCVDASLSDQDLAALFRNLRLLRTDSYNDFEIVVKGYVAVETLREVKRLTGNNFPQFLEANYDSGRGALAGLVRDILHYLNGKQGQNSVLTSLRMHEHMLEAAGRSRAAAYTPTVRPGSGVSMLNKGYVVEDYDLYRLTAGIGPAAVGRIFLLLGGETYYA